MLFEVVTLGGLLFWLAILAFIICEWVSIRNEKWGLVWLEFLTLMVVLTLFSNIGIGWLSWMLYNPIELITFALAYLLIGTAWGYTRWRWVYVYRKAEEYEKRREELKAEYNKVSIRSGGIKSIKEWLADIGYPPSAQRNKSRIIMWMLWFPISIIDTLLTDLVYRVFEALYEKIAKTLQRVSEQAFADRFDEMK